MSSSRLPGLKKTTILSRNPIDICCLGLSFHVLSVRTSVRVVTLGHFRAETPLVSAVWASHFMPSVRVVTLVQKGHYFEPRPHWYLLFRPLISCLGRLSVRVVTLSHFRAETPLISAVWASHFMPTVRVVTLAQKDHYFEPKPH